MDVRKFTKDEAELISETTDGTFEAVRQIVRHFFAHYVSEHTNGEDDVLAVTEFYEHLQGTLETLEAPTAEEVMTKAAEHVDAKKKSK